MDSRRFGKPKARVAEREKSRTDQDSGAGVEGFRVYGEEKRSSEVKNSSRFWCTGERKKERKNVPHSGDLFIVLSDRMSWKNGKKKEASEFDT